MLVHEIGHIVGAHIGRLRICEVSFGKTTRFVGTVRKIRLRLAWTPLPGLVRALPTNTRRYRIRMLVFIACGPLFTAGYELFLAKDDSMRWEAADTFASAVLYGADREAMPRAIEVLETIIAEFPSIITLKGTLGGLLFELGRIDEAEKTLREVIAESTAAIDQGISSAYLARIAEQRGSTEEAQKFAEAATKHSGEMAVVKRILAGLRGSQP